MKAVPKIILVLANIQIIFAPHLVFKNGFIIILKIKRESGEKPGQYPLL
jgi:hypothetical protein